MNGVTRVAGRRWCTCGGLCLARLAIHCVCGVPHCDAPCHFCLHCVRHLIAWLKHLAELFERASWDVLVCLAHLVPWS